MWAMPSASRLAWTARRLAIGKQSEKLLPAKLRAGPVSFHRVDQHPHRIRRRQVHAQNPAVTRGERFKIAKRLRAFQHTEAQPFSRNFKVYRSVSRDLEE
jgi:hypothetical protein